MLSVLLHLETLGRKEGLHEVVLNTKIQNCLGKTGLITLLPWQVCTASLASSTLFDIVLYFYMQLVLLEIIRNCQDRCNYLNLIISPFWARTGALWFFIKDYTQYCFGFFVPWILCQIVDLQDYKGERSDKSSNCFLFRCLKCGLLCTVFKIQPELSSPITYCVTQVLLRGSRGGRVDTRGQHQHPNCVAAFMLALILCHLTGMLTQWHK